MGVFWIQNPDSDHLSHVDCVLDSNPDSGPGARVNVPYNYYVEHHSIQKLEFQLYREGPLTCALCIICVFLFSPAMVSNRRKERRDSLTDKTAGSEFIAVGFPVSSRLVMV